MKHQSRYSLLLFVSSVLVAPMVLAADAGTSPAAADNATTGAVVENASPEVTASASMHVLRERMREMRRTDDPARRMQLMEAQMNQLDDVIRSLDGACPMPDLAPGMMGMTDGRGGTGMTRSDEMLAKRMEMMEKRMDMMQMMLQRQSPPAAGTETDANVRR